MSDAAIFVLFFGGFVVLRVAAATVLFIFLLPRGDRCPNCDAVTVRVQPTGLDRLMPWLRLSWCLACGWQGMLRHGPLTPPPSAAALPPARAGDRTTRGSRE